MQRQRNGGGAEGPATEPVKFKVPPRRRSRGVASSVALCAALALAGLAWGRWARRGLAGLVQHACAPVLRAEKNTGGCTFYYSPKAGELDCIFHEDRSQRGPCGFNTSQLRCTYPESLRLVVAPPPRCAPFNTPSAIRAAADVWRDHRRPAPPLQQPSLHRVPPVRRAYPTALGSWEALGSGGGRAAGAAAAAVAGSGYMPALGFRPAPEERCPGVLSSGVDLVGWARATGIQRIVMSGDSTIRQLFQRAITLSRGQPVTMDATGQRFAHYEICQQGDGALRDALWFSVDTYPASKRSEPEAVERRIARGLDNLLQRTRMEGPARALAQQLEHQQQQQREQQPDGAQEEGEQRGPQRGEGRQQGGGRRLQQQQQQAEEQQQQGRHLPSAERMAAVAWGGSEEAKAAAALPAAAGRQGAVAPAGASTGSAALAGALASARKAILERGGGEEEAGPAAGERGMDAAAGLAAKIAGQELKARATAPGGSGQQAGASTDPAAAAGTAAAGEELGEAAAVQAGRQLAKRAARPITVDAAAAAGAEEDEVVRAGRGGRPRARPGAEGGDAAAPDWAGEPAEAADRLPGRVANCGSREVVVDLVMGTLRQQQRANVRRYMEDVLGGSDRLSQDQRDATVLVLAACYWHTAEHDDKVWPEYRHFLGNMRQYVRHVVLVTCPIAPGMPSAKKEVLTKRNEDLVQLVAADTSGTLKLLDAALMVSNVPLGATIASHQYHYGCSFIATGASEEGPVAYPQHDGVGPKFFDTIKATQDGSCQDPVNFSLWQGLACLLGAGQKQLYH